MNRTVAVALAVVLQLALVGVATADRLSARLFGEEYLLRVQPVDPIDPFRGAYVDLNYPDLTGTETPWDWERPPGDGGDLFVPLEKDGEFVVAAGRPVRSRPSDGLYLACSDRDFRLRCGIESWFLPQDKAKDLEQAIIRGDAVARVKVDGRGHAALLGVEIR